MKHSGVCCISAIVFAGLFSGIIDYAEADSLTQEFPAKTALAKKPVVYAFGLQNVKLLDGPFKRAMDLNGAWMKSLDPDFFLSRYRRQAGLEAKVNSHVGAGQLGHHLSGCAIRYAATGDKELKNRIDYIVDELAICQDAHGDGYLAAYDGKEIFEQKISKGQIESKKNDLNDIGQPWYINHKVMAGLRDAYVYAENQKALMVLRKMADWALGITKALTKEQWQKMLVCQYGGMNEVLADVYVLTGEEKYLVISKKFYDKAILDPLSRRQDILPGLHANTQIPKIVGTARIYELTGDEKFGIISEFFWDTVVNHYTFVNGGNSACESFGRPDELSKLLYHTAETCNTYNMLKLTRHLYALNPQKKYMDYYERALWNHILAHQNHKTGMVLYKGILDMPARKKFSTPFNSFWCCVGTGFESHNKYGECIWAYGKDGLYLNQFIASELNWKDKGLTVKLETDFPESDTIKLTFGGQKSAGCSLKIRKPCWANAVTCTVNDRPPEILPDSTGYLVFDRVGGGDTMLLKMSMTLHAETMPDKPNRTAFLYGPIVLAADLSGDTPLPTLDGKSPSLLPEDLSVGDPLPILQGTPQELVSKIKAIPGKPLEFIGEKISKGFEENAEVKDVHLIPLYKVVNEKYTVYMDTFTDTMRKQMLQSQRDLNVTGKNITTGQHSGRNWRQAENGGWFAFDLKIPPEGRMELVLTYWRPDDRPRQFDILVNDVKIAEETMKTVKFWPFTDITYSIPVELTRGKEKVRVKLAAKPGKIAGRLYDAKIIKKATD